MKRFLLALFGGLLLIVPVFAQLGGFSQRGRATQQMKTEGLRAAHNNIPLDSKAKVINTVTGKEIEVTVTGRIPVSPNRILDLSPAAWEALGLSSDTVIVLVYSPSSVSQAAITPLEPSGQESEIKCEPVPVLAAGIRVVPALPNPNSNKIYRLQVGAFASQSSADRIERQVRNAGFDAAQEMYGSLHRVLAEGIPAADVIPAANALGAAGFKEIWVREDTRPGRAENQTSVECPDDESRSEPEAEIKPEAETGAETKAEPEAEFETETGAEAEPETDPASASQCQQE